MKRSMLCLTYLFLISLNTQAQSQITGKVVSDDQKPLEFASVSLYPLHDTTAIKGVMTNQEGTFRFTGLKPTNYQLTIQMLGYKDWTQAFVLTKDTSFTSITLSEEVIQLATMEIVTEQSYLESHLGKKVLRIGKDLSATGSNALEALETMPSVTTTPRGQIQIRGNSNVIVYINGKETKRDPATLKFIAAESLEKIEIITNPSAKYDAEGVGGIINIVYKKNQNNAFKLELVSNLAFLTNPFYIGPNGGLNFSWNKKKFSFFTNLSHDYGQYEDYVNSKRLNYSDDLQYYENLTTQKGLGNVSDVLIGCAIEPDSTSSIGLETSFVRWDFLSKIHQQNLFDYRSSEARSISIQNERGEIENELWVNLSYEKTFKKEQTLQVSLTAGGENETNFTRGTDIDLTTLPATVQQFLLSSDELESQRYHHGKVDYEIPLQKWGTIEAGFKLDFIRYHILQQLAFQSNAIQVPDNDFEMDMQKLGIYLLQKKKIKQFDYAIGLRLEQFASEAFQESNQSSFTQKYIRLFPSLQFNYLLDDYDHTIGFNYTRRINRPGFFDLNPYISYEDPLNLETGNPALEPEIADLMEITYHKEWTPFSIDLTVYHRTTNNSIQTVIEPMTNNQTLSNSVNIGQEISRGIEAQLEYRPGSFFKTSGTLVLAQNSYEDAENEISFNNQLTWSARFKQELKLKHDWKIEMSEIYRAASYEMQQKRHQNYYMNVGINKKFNNKRGSISLTVRDLFNTKAFIQSLHTNSFEVERTYKWQTRQVNLGIKYILFDVQN